MRVRIFKPSKTAAQSGRAKTHFWAIEPEDGTPRVSEPIMGWFSAEDAYSTLRGRLRFGSMEEAAAFAKNKGWDVVMQEPHEPCPTPKSYMDNFIIVRPQDEERSAR